MFIIIRQPDHIHVEVEPHHLDMVTNHPEECFKQHLHFMYEKFIEELEKTKPQVVKGLIDVRS